MAPQDAFKFNPLRVVTQRLSSTPSRQLPHIASCLASTIAQCGNTFTTTVKDGQAIGGSDSTVVSHKFKTQLSALLQDKSPEARYAAVILIKVTVEVGGWNVLQGVGIWVRGLISILGVSSHSKSIMNNSQSIFISDSCSANRMSWNLAYPDIHAEA